MPANDTALGRSLDYYSRQAQTYFDATAHLEMAPVRSRFTARLRAGARVLDAGCGSGRDARAFAEAGFEVEAFDACPELVALASEFTGLPVQCQTFADLQGQGTFDGAWACSSLVHLEEAELVDALQRLSSCLVEDGCIYLNFKVGTEPFVDADGRYFNPATPARAARLCEAAGLWVTELWVTNSLRQPDVQWLNILALKRFPRAAA